MSIRKKKLKLQRRIIDKKLLPWKKLRLEKRPPSGWLKAVRIALGLSARQLANKLGVQHSSILRLEKREVQGKASIESLGRAAKAMNCQLVYAVIPQADFNTLEDIVDQRAVTLARHLVKKAEHTMRLEKQGVSVKETKQQISDLAFELKSKMDSRLWESFQSKKKRK